MRIHKSGVLGTPLLWFNGLTMPTRSEKFLASIGYLDVLCILPLALKRNSPFAQHHGKQGLVLLFCWIALWILSFVSFLGPVIWFVGSVVLGILSIMGIVNAFSGKMWEMPVLGVYAKKLKF